MAGVALLLGMQAAPGVDGDGAVLVILAGQGGGRGRPGGRVGAVELGAVAARPTAFGRARRWCWVGVETAVGAQPHQHRDGQVSQVEGELGGVIAAIEDEQRWLAAGGQACHEGTDLAGGNLVGVLGRVQPGRVDRGGPRIAVEAELADPLVGPAGDDRLAGRMPGGMVVVATLRPSVATFGEAPALS